MAPYRITPLKGIAIAALLALGLGACTKQHANAPSPFLRDHVGEHCVVQFRRDALGAAANLPVPPQTGTINGADVASGGKLVSVEGDAIVIAEPVQGTETTKQVWIPNHSILSVEFDPAK